MTAAELRAKIVAEIAELEYRLQYGKGRVGPERETLLRRRRELKTQLAAMRDEQKGAA